MQAIDNPLSLLGLAALIGGGLLLWAWPGRGLRDRLRAGRDAARRERVEDALKHLFSLEMDGRRPSLSSVAGALGLGQDAAAELLSQMAAGDWVDLSEGQIRLSAPGRDWALRVVRAHRLWEHYLAERTGYDERDWHRLAERAEHKLSPQAADALAQSLGNPSYDPHGDPIPTADGALSADGGRALSTLAAGERARIVHLEDEPPAIYGQLVAEGLHPGLVLRVLESGPQRVRFWAGDAELLLSPLLAGHVHVQPLSQDPAGEAETLGQPLAQLRPGQAATILALSPALRGAERRRLLDLGFLPGTHLEVVLRSPAGDPTAYRVRGSLIALRGDQARHVRVQPA